MRLLYTIMFIMLFCLGAPLSSRAASDPGQADTLWVDSATAFVTGIGVVPIHFFNDEELTYVEVTLEHQPTAIQVDSFSFAGGRLDDEVFNNDALIDDDSTKITIFSFSTGAIPTGSGLLGRLYYSYSHTISPQLVPIDSVTWLYNSILHATKFRAVGSTESFVPQFVRGYLDIEATPDTYDSVWIDQIEAAPGDPIVLDVYALNERNLAKIALALDYSDVLLGFDSVSFLGTRSEPAPNKTVQAQTSLHKLYAVINFGETVPLAPGSGPVAKLYFTIDAAMSEGLVVIDSTTVGIISNTRFTLTDDDGSINFVPRFRAGSVNVKISTGIEDIGEGNALPTDYNLAQNYPNPFNPSTNIEFSLPRAGRVRVEIFNILGHRVRLLLEQDLPAGEHRVSFDGHADRGGPLATGVYFYRMTTEGFEQTRKMILLK